MSTKYAPYFLPENGFDDGFIIRTTYELDKYIEDTFKKSKQSKEK